MARTDGGGNKDSGHGGAGTPGSGRDSSSSSGGRSSGSSSSSGGRSSGSASSGAASSAGRSSGASSSASAGRSSGSASAGRSSGGINAGGGGDNSRSTGGASSSGNSRGGTAAGASSGRSSSGTSSASTGRSSAGTGRSSGGGTIGAGLSGSGLADRGGRVTGGGFDSGRFGDAPAAEKGGRVGASPQAEKGGRVTSPDAGRFSGGSSVGRQSSKGGSFSNGGRNSDRSGARASAAPARSASVGTGLGVGLTAPSRSARAAETASMDALSRSRTESRSRNYGAGLAQSARAVEDRSMGALHDYDREVVGVRSAGAGFTEVQRRDGTIERRDGTRASRNNNPGNLEYGEFAKSKGAIGTDGRFGVFSTPAQGRQAMEDLVFGPSYAGRTIQEAVERYAPPHENNSRSYASSIAAAAGVPVGTTVRDLTPSQRTAMVDQMTRVEGNKPHATTTIAQGTPRGTAPAERRNTRFEQTYMASAAPAPAANLERQDRLPGLAGIAPSLTAPAPSPTKGTLGTVASFDRSRLTAGVTSIVDAIDQAVPGAGVNSAYRDPAHNARVGGARGSQHIQGNAVDINMRGWSDDQRRAALDAAVASGVRGIGIYNGGTTLHVDARPTSKSMWGGNPAGQYAPMSVAQAPEWARETLSAWKDGKPAPANAREAIASVTGPAATNPSTRTRSAERFEQTYLGDVATPTARPERAAPTRSMGDKMIAGAIDLGVGLLPGVGTAAGLYSMAAPMLGLPTVGDMALSMRDRSTFDLGTSLKGQRESEGGRDDRGVDDNRGSRERLQGEVQTAEAAPQPTTFEEKYLAFNDSTYRPTPGQKWGAVGAPSAGAYAL